MKVRIFSALTMQEAMAQVKSALGRDAIILHTRKFRKGGIGGFFGHEMIEVMAAVDTNTSPAPAYKPVAKKPVTKVKSLIQEKPNIQEKPKEIEAVEVRVPSKPLPVLEPLALPRIITDKSAVPGDDLRSEITGMRQMLEQLLTKTKTAPTNPWYDYLVKKEIVPLYAEQLLQGFPVSAPALANNPDAAKQLIFERIIGYFKSNDGIKVGNYACKKVALIGPTGVGKTTTLAKLAARFTLENNLSVAFITSDTYRIAAVEQLRTYANILNIPLEVVYSSEEMHDAIEKHRDKQLLLIDTAGRSQYNDEQMQELKDLLAIDDTIETHLVLSSTTKHQDAVDIVDRFSCCASDSIIFTKIDEARNIGTIFNIMYKFPTLSISYITNGQSVPDDIQPAQAGKLAEMLLRD